MEKRLNSFVYRKINIFNRFILLSMSMYSIFNGTINRKYIELQSNVCLFDLRINIGFFFGDFGLILSFCLLRLQTGFPGSSYLLEFNLITYSVLYIDRNYNA